MCFLSLPIPASLWFWFYKVKRATCILAGFLWVDFFWIMLSWRIYVGICTGIFSIRECPTVDAQGVLAMGSVQSSAVCPLHFRSVFCSSVSGGVPVFFPACSWVLPLGVRARPTLLPCLDPAFSFFFARDPKRGNMRTLFEFVIFILVTSFLFPAKIICWELQYF